LENAKGRHHLEDIGLNERIILKWTLEEHDGKLWTEFIWPWIETIGRLCWA
jgi:hypothetical protein